MSYIRWFRETDVADVELVGGKGANLGEMVRVGLPVPPGFCLTAGAYRDFVRATGLDGAIQGILAEVDLDDPADVEAKTVHIRRLILEQDVPAKMVWQLVDGYQRLAWQLGKAKVTQIPVAVRSSATAEDLPTVSFAGQQETYLNVRGVEALLESVKRCWASLWTARALIYRARQGFDHQRVYLAVVVQAMIQSEVSGILFTANPVTGNCDEAVVNASWGLGEAIVSGLVTPDTFTVRKADGQVVSRQIPAKTHMVAYAEDGGTVEQEVASEWQEVPSLSDGQVGELVALGQQIESHYDAPQDIEWAYLRGELYVLQSRAITTLHSTPGAASQPEYNRTMFIEIFPDPLSPIFLSVIAPLFHSMLDFTFEALGFKPPQDQNAIGVFYNHVYFNRDYIAGALEPLSPPTQERLVSQLVNPFGRHEQGIKGEFSLPYLRMVARMLRFMVRFPKQLPYVIARYRAEIAEAAALPVETLSDREIALQIQTLVWGASSRLLNYDFLMIALIGITYQMLGTLLERYFGEETEELRGKLISGVTGNVTMETNEALWDLAQVAKASPTVSQVLRQYDEQEAMSNLAQTPEGQTFLDALERFLGEYGHREIRLDILYPTWGEGPAPVLAFVRGYLDAQESSSPHLQQARLVEQRQALTERVRERVTQDRLGRHLIWSILRRVLEHTQTHTRERDTMHFELTRLFPPLRRMLLEVGRRWSERGLLANPDDIFFISLDELSGLAESPRPMSEVVQARRVEYEANKRHPWPNIIQGDQEIYAESAAPAESPEGHPCGVAGSPGVVTGVARVIRGPEDFGKLQNGDVLVAPLTNPVWTPLFAIAGGVVTEVGGILSHGAIVAREYGIPAVMGVAGATQWVAEGQMVTVDGNKGVVRFPRGT